MFISFVVSKILHQLLKKIYSNKSEKVKSKDDQVPSLPKNLFNTVKDKILKQTLESANNVERSVNAQYSLAKEFIVDPMMGKFPNISALERQSDIKKESSTKVNQFDL